MKNSRPKGSVAYDNAGRVVLVSGGASGIGRAICDAFADSGADVVCLDINADAAVDLPDGIAFVAGDTSQEDDCRNAIDFAVQTFGALDVLVNNAAIQLELPSKISVAAVWLNARLAAIAGRSLRLSSLGMRVQVILPASDRRGLPTMLKSLLDGLISSLHCHNGSGLDVVLPRLSKQLGVDSSVLENALMSGPKELGSRSLIHPFKQSVQWNPADELFTQLHISRADGETPSCVMEVFEM